MVSGRRKDASLPSTARWPNPVHGVSRGVLVDGGLARGAAAGGVATLGMSVVMGAAQKLGIMGRQPPKHITERALHSVGVRPTEACSNAVASAAHLGFGASAGAFYGWLHERLRLERWPVAAPLAFAGGIWIVSYRGWLPLLGILPPPEHDRAGRAASMIIAHTAYGLILGGVLRVGSTPTGRG